MKKEELIKRAAERGITLDETQAEKYVNLSDEELENLGVSGGCGTTVGGQLGIFGELVFNNQGVVILNAEAAAAYCISAHFMPPQQGTKNSCNTCMFKHNGSGPIVCLNQGLVLDIKTKRNS